MTTTGEEHTIFSGTPDPEPEPPIKKRVSVVTTIEIDWGDETGELEVHTSSMYRDEDTFISEFTSTLDGMEGDQRIYSHSEDAALAMHGVLVARGVAYATKEAQRLAEVTPAIEAMPLGKSLLAHDPDECGCGSDAAYCPRNPLAQF